MTSYALSFAMFLYSKLFAMSGGVGSLAPSVIL
jgi:hypothetical protein